MLLAEVLPTAPTATEEALALFDAAPAVDAASMIGTWHGAELPTGHPMDGMLELSGWRGKQFVDAETVHPLLFPTADGSALWPLNPTLAFAGLGATGRLPGRHRLPVARGITALRPALAARGPKARLRTTRYRGVDTATMIYDQLPIMDVFRRLDPGAADTPVQAVLGAMDARGSRRPYFFVLRRDDSLPVR